MEKATTTTTSPRPVSSVDAIDNHGSSQSQEDALPEGQRWEELYGRWQTEKWDPGEADEAGNVPTNGYGNVELWTMAHLPRGCVHVSNTGTGIQ